MAVEILLVKVWVQGMTKRWSETSIHESAWLAKHLVTGTLVKVGHCADALLANSDGSIEEPI